MNLFVLLDRQDLEIKRISISQDIQTWLNNYLQDSIKSFRIRPKIEFEGQYKPEENEILCISNYKIPYNNSFTFDTEILLSASRDIERIKAIIFKFSDSKLAFQNFDSRKIISPNKLNLIFNGNTFS